jgi:hypothetical protein
MELQKIQQMIYEVRGVKVMLDTDLAVLYGVETKALKRAVRRNIQRFPSDFMFEVTPQEQKKLKFQIGTSSLSENQEVTNLRYQNGTSSWGGIRYNAFAFTELGVAMLSSVLNSDTAININISIMRAFVAIRQNLPIVSTQKELEDLKQRIIALEESDIDTHNAIRETKEELIKVYQALTELGESEKEPIPEVGFAAIEKRRNN